MDNPKELTHISLCAGYGGIDLGLKRAIGLVRTICYVEIENFVIDNLVKKIEANLIDNCPVYTNLKTFPWELFSGRVDILSGGFPCQPFSAAGRRKGSEDPRHLWPYITDGIKRLGRPAIVYFENVEGIISSKLKGDDWSDPEGTPVLLHVLRELERLGYKATASVFSASEIGAPHQRKRVFILGVRNDLAETGISLINGLIKSNQSDRNTAYPASRRQKQYWYEPPRVTMGDSTGERLERVKQKNESSSKVWGFTSYAHGDRELDNSNSELGDSNGGNKESHGVEHRILHSETECREASGLERASDVAELDNTDSKGLLRDRNESPNPHSERRETQIRHNAQADTSSRELQGETESPLGRNVDGVTNRLDYAELYESCDNRTDELRMLGNGVVPDTATRGFRVLWRELGNSTK